MDKARGGTLPLPALPRVGEKLVGAVGCPRHFRQLYYKIHPVGLVEKVRECSSASGDELGGRHCLCIEAGNAKYRSESNCLIETESKTLIFGCKNSLIPAISADDPTVGVTVIGDNAFSQCITLTSIVIPEGVTTVGVGAFNNCTALSSVTVPSTVTEIGSNAFRSCISLPTIQLPKGFKVINEYTFADCTLLNDISLPGSITEIRSGAFHNCESLTEIAIGFNVTLIGNYAFEGCSSLRRVHFHNPNDWVTAYSEIQEGGTPISSSTLSNATKAASYVKGDSSKWHMKRISNTVE